MRATILSLLACLSLTFAAPFVRAQGCRDLYTFNYDSYATESGNATTIFTTVITEGSGSGDPLGCYFPNVKHTPSAYNTITPAGGSKVGGWVYGSAGSMTSYLQAENEQQVAAAPGLTYVFDAEGEVICSVFGELYNFTFNFPFELALTKTQTNFSSPDLEEGEPGVPAICPQNNWCSPATTPPLCPVPGMVIEQEPVIPIYDAQCASYYNSLWFAEKLTGSWTCLPLLPTENAEGTSDSTLGKCTIAP